MSIFLINRFSFVSSSIEVSELPPSGHFPVCDSTSSLGSSLQYSIVPDLRDVEWIFLARRIVSLFHSDQHASPDIPPAEEISVKLTYAETD